MGFSLEFLSHVIYDGLVVVYVVLPYAVAPHQYELIAFLPFYFLYVRLARYHLLVVRQRLAFVVEVSERSRQVESSVDSSHRYLSSCLPDTLLFDRVLRFMVL